MENREVAIQLSGVKKQYRLGQIGGGTLQKDLQSWWAKVRKKEDPNSMIGQEQRLVGESFMALNGIDLTIYKGEALGIIGGNGAGKSTMLKLLSRVTAPSEGTIDIFGRITSMLEVGTGFNGEMTGRENVYMNGAILGMTKAEIDAKMEDIIEFSEVREFIDTPVKRYSSGMYVKLAFSVAAHLDSEIMIMDEVLAVGDMAFQKKCLTKMREAAKREGRTVLYVSHNMNTIRQLCDRCVVLDKGQIIFEGGVEESIEVYLGTRIKRESFVNVDQMKRGPVFENLLGHMYSLEIINCPKACFEMNSELKGKLIYKCLKNIDEVHLRIIIKTLESVPVTMITTTKGVRASKDVLNCIEFKIDLSHIAPGRYTLCPVIYEVDENGTAVNLDGLSDVYTFEVIPVSGFNNNMPWMSRFWGHLYNGELQITDYQENVY